MHAHRSPVECPMRGRRNLQSNMLAFVNLDERVPPDYSLRIIERVAGDILGRVSDNNEVPHVG